MAGVKLDFSDIKLIICVQGYSLDYQYIVREIGYWCNGTSGSIPFNIKLNRNQLDVKNQQLISYFEEEVNGIPMKSHFDNGLALSETKAVLRTLYHLNSDSKAKYIGICGDEYIVGLLYKAGLGNFVYDLSKLNDVTQFQRSVPTSEDLQQFMKRFPDKYQICKIHDRLRNSEIPICAKVKAQYLADYFFELAADMVGSHPDIVSYINSVNFDTI